MGLPVKAAANDLLVSPEFDSVAIAGNTEASFFSISALMFLSMLSSRVFINFSIFAVSFCLFS